MTEKDPKLGFATRAVHAGQSPAPGNRALTTPVYFSSTFVQESPGVYDTYDYARTGNPTRTALEENLASLEGGKFGVCFGSGCAAGDAVLHLLQAGDHVICADDLDGGMYRLFEKIFRSSGLDFSHVDLSSPEAFDAACTAKTKLLWIESPTNPLLKVLDIRALAERAKKRNVLSIVDNTFCSPYIQSPLHLGADMVLESCTKYIGGHADVLGGVVCTSNAALAERLHYIQNAVGGVPSPMDCYLLLRSTKTLSLRMERHSANAQRIAEHLLTQSKVEKVIYPGLKSHPQHELAAKQMRTGGGMVSMVLKGDFESAKKFLTRLRIFSLAESLGGVQSLIEHPASMTHLAIPKEVRLERGIGDGLIRLSVGIEDADDLIADLQQALSGV